MPMKRQPQPKPEADGFWDFYLVKPIRSVKNAVFELLGGWYCLHCDKYHGPRVHKFDYYHNYAIGSACSLSHLEQQQQQQQQRK